MRAEGELELRPRLEKEARELATNEVAAKTRAKNAPSPIHSTPIGEQNNVAQVNSDTKIIPGVNKEGEVPTIQIRTSLEQSNNKDSDGDSGKNEQDAELPTAV